MKIRRARKSRWSLRFLGLIIITYTKTFNACSSAKNLSKFLWNPFWHTFNTFSANVSCLYPLEMQKNLCFILKSFQNNKWSQANGFFHNILTALILNISITVLNSAFFEGMFIDPKISFFSEIYGFGVTKSWGPPDFGFFQHNFSHFQPFYKTILSLVM